MKKWLLLVLISSFLITGVIGCGQKANLPDKSFGTNAKPTADNDSDKDSNDGIVSDEPLEISMTLYRGPKTEDTWIQEEMEEKLNVKFDFIMLPGADEVKAKTNLLMSDPKTRPDVLWWTGQEKEFQQWIEEGIIVDMMPYLKEHGSNILGYYGPETLFHSYQDGKIYKLPGDVAEPSCMTTMIRGDWLENLNLEVPTTIDQYMDVMKAFTRDDPDGNGEDDTYGFSGQAGEWRVFSPFLLPFKAQPEHFIVTEDGSVKHGSVQPEMKEALKVLREAFQENLIDPTMLTTNDFDEILVSGDFGSTYRWIAYFNPSNSLISSFKENNPGGEYISIEAIGGPDGFSSDEPEDVGGWCFVSITDAAENPEEVFKVLDKMAESEFFKFRKWGEEGVHYELTDGVLNKLIPAEDEAGLGMNLLADFFNRKDESNIENAPEVTELFNQRAITSQPIRDMRIRFKEATRPMWIEYGADIEAKRDEIFYGIMAGDFELDEFDNYVEQFYQMGGNEVEEEAQEFYNRQISEYEEFMDVYNADLNK